LESTRLDTLDAYVVRSGVVSEHFVTGNLRPAAPRMLDYLRPAFPVPLQPGEEVEFLLRVHTETSVQLPLSIRSVAGYVGAKAETAGATSAFFGYLKALILLGLVFGVITRARGMVAYSAAMVGVLTTYKIMSGSGNWPEFPVRAIIFKQGLILSGEFAMMMMILFLRRLLDLRVTLPTVDRWLVRVSWVNAALTLVFLALPFRVVMTPLFAHVLIMGMVLMMVSLHAWRKGIPAARFYAVAWGVFWASYGISGGFFIAREPMPGPAWEYALQGFVVSATLFLLAIVERVREIQRAANQTQRNLLVAERRAAAQLRLQIRQRQSFIRDLHDGIGGLTANLSILAELGRRQAAAERDREHFARISDLATDGSTEVRSLMRSLEAGEMSWDDLVDEIRRQGRTALEPHGIKFSLTVTGATDQAGPGLFAGPSLLRLVKEALSNSVKHAACTRVEAEAVFAPGALRLTLRDNGRGLPEPRTGGRGLRNMASRIEEIGGSMTLRKAKGVELVFELPLPVTLVNPSTSENETTTVDPQPSTLGIPAPPPKSRPADAPGTPTGFFQ